MEFTGHLGDKAAILGVALSFIRSIVSAASDQLGARGAVLSASVCMMRKPADFMGRFEFRVYAYFELAVLWRARGPGDAHLRVGAVFRCSAVRYRVATHSRWRFSFLSLVHITCVRGHGGRLSDGVSFHACQFGVRIFALISGGVSRALGSRDRTLAALACAGGGSPAARDSTNLF